MKSCAFLLVFFLIFLSIATEAQIQADTTHHYPAIDTSDFFPMQIGNYWEYKSSTAQGDSCWKITIVGDTLMPNGKRYFQFHLKSFGVYGSDYINWFYRKDSNDVYISGGPGCNTTYEYKIFDLTPGLKDSTVWETCRYPYFEKPLGRGVRISYNYSYSDWYPQPVEARFFVDVTFDSLFKITKWGPSDASEHIILVKGIGMVYKGWVSDEHPYYLEGAIINGKKFGTITSVEHEKSIIPSSMNIQAYPNPFNSTVNLNIELKSAGMTELMVFNILGQKVATIFEDYKPSGNFKFSFNADNLSSGVYFVLLKQGRFFCKEKIILLK
ncbi:MAG: T9SS type A sorting domain-containing protein [Syntrophomonadaceae bacterium]